MTVRRITYWWCADHGGDRSESTGHRRGTADISQLPHLLPGQESTRHGDKSYYQADDKLKRALSSGRYLVNQSAKRTDFWSPINQRLCGFATARYRGFAKNTT